MEKIGVLFVCLGNICRSPTAHAVFAHKVMQAGLNDRIEVDSAGTAAYHLGKAPDERSTAAAALRGYDLAPLRARQVTVEDFQRFDLIMAMDLDNLDNLRVLGSEPFQGRLGLFLECLPSPSFREVPDPYYGGRGGFEQVLDLVEAASDELLSQLRKQTLTE
jgi:protein-tyrosine phosphatase